MRICLVPIDSRPPNWQFPRQLAAIAGIEILTPPRSWLGSLHTGADGLKLADWLAEHAPGCDAAVFSWDALLYGGLIQSRQPERETTNIEELQNLLRSVDWRRVEGYAYGVVPRLGISVTSAELLNPHEQVREYFELQGNSEQAGRRAEVAVALGEELVARVEGWRARNQRNNLQLIDFAAELQLRHLHFAVEDNASSGPHLAEVAGLQERAASYASRPEAPAFSSFDGTDEAACLLLARAAWEKAGGGLRPVRLVVHPELPGADRYTGRFESHTLREGLDFLSEFLGFDYEAEQAPISWLVTYGIQPQPDGFAKDPAQYHSNPYLLPDTIPERSALFVTDLAVCNCGNPRLAEAVLQRAGDALMGFVGFNTNFNALGVSAALISLALAGGDIDALSRFLVARLADDVVYQSLARPKVLELCKQRQSDPMDFAAGHYFTEDDSWALVRRQWLSWLEKHGEALLDSAGINHEYARELNFSFPWHRAFEIEVTDPSDTIEIVEPAEDEEPVDDEA